MNVGISTACMYPKTTEESLRILTDYGIKYFEIFINSISELEPEFVNSLKNILNSSNAVLKSFHPFTSGYEPYLIFSDYYRRYKDTLDFYERYFEATQKLGGSILIIHGDKRTSKNGISDEEYFNRFGELSLRAEKYGIIVAQENVNLFRSQNPEFIGKMINYLKDKAKFVLDTKQVIRSGNSLVDTVSAMGENIVNVHISDHTEKDDCILPCSGVMQYEPFVSKLKKQNYQGDFIIEVYNNCYDTDIELINSYKKLSKIIKSIYTQ